MGNSKEGDRAEDLSDLGGIALISRFIKQLWTHRGLYLGILVLFVLPTMAVPQVILLLGGVNPATKQDFVRKLAAGNFTDAEVKPTVLLAWIFASDLLQTVLMTIQYIPIVFTAASLLTNKTVVLSDAIRAVGRLWKPVLLTVLSFSVVYYGLVAIVVPAMYVYASYGSSFTRMVLPIVSLLALLAFIGFAFQMVPIVPVLERVYGWKALGRSWKLLQGKKWVALRMMILLVLLIVVIAFPFQLFLQSVLILIGISNASTAGSVATFVLNLFLLSVDNVLIIGTEAFLYFSCRDLHQESIRDSASFEAQVMKEGFEKLTQHPETYDVESLKTPGS